MQLLAELLKVPDIPSIMTTNKQVHTDLGNCMASGYGRTCHEVFAFDRRLMHFIAMYQTR